jgi:hypothetical protein
VYGRGSTLNRSAASRIDIERHRVRVATTRRYAVEVNGLWAVNPDFDRSGIHNLGRWNDGRQFPNMFFDD